MAQPIEIKLPSLGDEDDTVAGGTIALWHAEEGAWLAAEDDLLEITTDKAAFVVPCPAAGRLVRRLVREGETVQVGAVLCLLDPDDSRD
jgi:pyruvate/2-oxoglutarate dehydrogenase complex dihydrolipoamide acyltransferase (E2) component